MSAIHALNGLLLNHLNNQEIGKKSYGLTLDQSVAKLWHHLNLE
jgi:hypothetical protein